MGFWMDYHRASEIPTDRWAAVAVRASQENRHCPLLLLLLLAILLLLCVVVAHIVRWLVVVCCHQRCSELRLRCPFIRRVIAEVNGSLSHPGPAVTKFVFVCYQNISSSTFLILETVEFLQSKVLLLINHPPTTSVWFGVMIESCWRVQEVRFVDLSALGSVV